MSKKLDKLFKALVVSQEAVQSLESAGIDLGKLGVISNMQGPVARILHGFITAAHDSLSDHQRDTGLGALSDVISKEVKSVPRALPSKSRKRRAGKDNSSG